MHIKGATFPIAGWRVSNVHTLRDERADPLSRNRARPAVSIREKISG